jgi:hypothetical protein
MDEYYKCSKIQVTSTVIPYFIPKTGECTLKIFDNYGLITLKTMKTKIYYDSPAEEEVVSHEVCLKPKKDVFFCYLNRLKRFLEI